MITTDIIGVIDATAGYHVNTTHPVADWATFKVTPASPRRVFGGGTTHYYTFADAAEFEAHLDTADMSIPTVQIVPQTVTMRQARLALLGAGLLSTVETAIAGAGAAAAIEWEYAGDVQRASGLVPAMATALGMSETQIDALFVQAATL